MIIYFNNIWIMNCDDLSAARKKYKKVGVGNCIRNMPNFFFNIDSLVVRYVRI